MADGLGWSLTLWPGQQWLASHPLGLGMDPLSLGTLLSLLGNFLVFSVVSWLSRMREAIRTGLTAEAGVERVLQLEGGILKYFELAGGRHFEGDCFVFDERDRLDPALRPAPA